MAAALSTSLLTRRSVLSGSCPAHSRTANPARVASRTLLVRAQQGSSDAAKKALGMIAAAQIALLPLTGAAVATTGAWNAADLQHEVGFFGNAKTSAPTSFSIFDADGINDARKKLKENIDAAVSPENRDPAEKVVSVGKPGESQEENAERVRREAENGPTTGGDARASTN